MFNRRRSQVAFALLGLCLANSTSNLVHAEDIEFVTTAEFESLHARLAEFERRLVHAESRTPAKNHCPICPNTPGIVAGAELLLIKPHHSEGETPGFGVNAASRFWLGWSGENGLGLRARWFQ